MSTWALLRRPAFARFMAGNLLSNVGSWIQDIAAAMLVFQLTESAGMVALVAVAGYGSALLLAPVGGQLTDRFDRRRLLITAHVLQGSIAIALAALVSAGAGVGVVVVFTFLIGLGRAVVNPALQAIVPLLVSRADFARATALQAVTFNGARVIGPAVGAVVVTSFGAGVAFALNAVSFFVFAALMLAIPTAMHKALASSTDSGLLGGLRYVIARPRLLLLLFCVAAAGVTTDPVLTLGPAFAMAFDEPEEWAGIFMSVFGAGAVVAAAFTERVRERVGPVRMAACCLLLAATGLAVIALAPSSSIALGGAACVGAAFLAGGTDATAALQELTDDHVRGRVMALWAMGFLGSRPIAAAFDGVLADLFSPAVASGVLGACTAASAGIVLAGYHRLGGREAFRVTGVRGE